MFVSSPTRDVSYVARCSSRATPGSHYRLKERLLQRCVLWWGAHQMVSMGPDETGNEPHIPRCTHIINAWTVRRAVSHSVVPSHQ
eukprot:5836814-Pyramimonas_sp.AAC.1